MREVVLYKNQPEVLRQRSAEVVEFGSALSSVVDDMTYVMRSLDKAIGIASVQVNVPLRLSLLELNYGKKNLGDPLVLVNPVILASGGLTLNDESCLSLPGMKVKVRRSDLLKVRYRTIEGISKEQLFRGIWARCLSHEVDHMNGKLIIDR